jgi:hypothetical protein
MKLKLKIYVIAIIGVMVSNSCKKDNQIDGYIEFNANGKHYRFEAPMQETGELGVYYYKNGYNTSTASYPDSSTHIFRQFNATQGMKLLIPFVEGQTGKVNTNTYYENFYLTLEIDGIQYYDNDRRNFFMEVSISEYGTLGSRVKGTFKAKYLRSSHIYKDYKENMDSVEITNGVFDLKHY